MKRITWLILFTLRHVCCQVDDDSLVPLIPMTMCKNNPRKAKHIYKSTKNPSNHNPKKVKYVYEATEIPKSFSLGSKSCIYKTKDRLKFNDDYGEALL
jgi:hypothetical protein